MSVSVGRRLPAAVFRCVLLMGGLLVWALPSGDARAAARPAFEPVKIVRINLPAKIKEASTPVFTLDGHHLLFFSSLHLWIVKDNGRGLACLSCGLANQPMLTSGEQMGFATEFPDRRRVFIGGAGSVAVLECTPNVTDCTSRRILPVDLSGAHGGVVVPPGGVDAGQALNEANAASPKLAPDGVHIALSDIRTDAAEVMIIATMTRTATGYVTSDPRVINPAAPSSPLDTNTSAWSNSSGLFEFKSFADGGAAATYVQVGGVAAGNPDVWRINLTSGKRTRLTSYPDWDEDNAPSPDGRSIVVESDRGMHRVDLLGALMPVRGFIDDPEVAVTASYFVAGPVDRQCDLQPWLLPATGDRGGYLMGEPLQPYTGGPVHAANNVSGYPQWNSSGTEIALNTESYETNRSAPYLLVAHLTARRRTRPVTALSSQPGAWAQAPASYHGPIGSVNHVVLHGAKAGTATVDYDNTQGLLGGSDSVTYRGYSDNGRDFVNGTYTITNTSIINGPVTVDSDLNVTGADTGYVHVDAIFSGTGHTPETVTGTASSNYDGTTRSGIPHVPQPCPSALPRAPRMRIAIRLIHRGSRRRVRVVVSATIRGAGPNEARLDTRPVKDAAITLGRAQARTSPSGVALLEVPKGLAGPVTIRAVAGDTLLPATARLSLTPG